MNKKILSGVLLSTTLLLSACGEEIKTSTNEVKEETKASEDTASEQKNTDTKKEETESTEKTTENKTEQVSEEESKESTINTDVYKFATKTEVTDAIDINDHVTVFVFMSEELKPGLAAQHVLNQSYDFIQQDDIKDAKNITIAVSQNNTKTFQFTVDKSKFKTDDSVPMSDLVLEASKVDKISPEVKEFAETLDWKIKE